MWPKPLFPYHPHSPMVVLWPHSKPAGPSLSTPLISSSHSSLCYHPSPPPGSGSRIRCSALALAWFKSILHPQPERAFQKCRPDLVTPLGTTLQGDTLYLEQIPTRHPGLRGPLSRRPISASATVLCSLGCAHTRLLSSPHSYLRAFAWLFPLLGMCFRQISPHVVPSLIIRSQLKC